MKKILKSIKKIFSAKQEMNIYPKGAHLPYAEDTIVDVEYELI